MNNDKMRKEFEVFAQPHTYSLKMIDGEYYAASTALLWQCWQASRAALVVELPEPYKVDGNDMLCPFEVDLALDKAGVSYK